MAVGSNRHASELPRLKIALVGERPRCGSDGRPRGQATDLLDEWASGSRPARSTWLEKATMSALL